MKRYLNKVKKSIKGFTTANFHQILREVDCRAKVAFADELVDDQIKVQLIPSIDVPNVH